MLIYSHDVEIAGTLLLVFSICLAMESLPYWLEQRLVVYPDCLFHSPDRDVSHVGDGEWVQTPLSSPVLHEIVFLFIFSGLK